MKKSIVLFVAACLIAGIILTSCKSKDEKAEDVTIAKDSIIQASEDLNKVKSDSISDYAMLKAKTSKLVAENEQKIAEFKMKLKMEASEKQEELQEIINKLEVKNSELKKDLETYTEAGKEKWEAFKERVQKSVDDINKDIENYKKEHK
jgi:hypothetical protein